jgi:catechol 2,3-dioxygenase-like lactoylglutathione lyase family enzyme
VKDVSRSIDFYTKHLGLKLDMKNLPAFGQVSDDDLPGAPGSRPMPDGRQKEPGAWNRVILQVKDLSAQFEALKKTGVTFGMRWRLDLAASKSSWKILMSIRSSCLSQLSSLCDARS